MRRALLAAAALVVAVVAGGFAFFALTGEDAPAPPRLSPGGTAVADGRYEPGAGSFVGYRVDEKYLGIGVRTAVGRTPRVTGTITVAGGRIAAADLRADMASLRSDQSRRDDALRGRGIETDRYPTARFRLLHAAPLTGRADGTLVLHGARAPVTAAVRGRRLELVGSVPIDFGDFAIEPPSVAGLVTVRDHGRLEFRLVLRPSA